MQLLQCSNRPTHTHFYLAFAGFEGTTTLKSWSKRDYNKSEDCEWTAGSRGGGEVVADILSDYK